MSFNAEVVRKWERPLAAFYAIDDGILIHKGKVMENIRKSVLALYTNLYYDEIVQNVLIN